MSSTPPPGSTPAGWYPDTNQPGTLRYWDGNQWTEHTHRQESAGYGAPGYQAQTYQPCSSVVQCPVHGLTGWWCPGCGSTRAVHALAHGDVALSLAAHPLVVPVAALLVYLWVRWVTTGASVATRLPRVVPLALASAFVALTVGRNVGWIAGPPLLG